MIVEPCLASNANALTMAGRGSRDVDEPKPYNEPSCVHERDLAGCRRTIEALHAASAYNRTLFEANPEALVTIGTTGTVTDVNGAAEVLFGLERQVIIGSDFTSCFTDPERVRRVLRHAQQRGSVRNRRLAVRQRGGRRVPVSCDNVVLKDERGRTVAILASLRPVTERRRGAEAQKQQHRRNQAILQAVGAGIYTVDLQGRCTFANAAAERLLGYGAEELLGRSPHDTFHHTRPNGTDYPEAECPLHREHGSAVASRGSGEWFQRKDGSTFPVEYVRTPLLGDGWVDGVAITFWDITERKQTEAALERSEAKFRTVYDANAIALAFWEPDGSITEANDAFLELTGHGRAELERGLVDWNTLTPPEYRPLDERALAKFARGERTIAPYEKEFVRQNGKRIAVLVGSTRFPGKEGGVAFAIDLTERKRMEEAVRMANAYNRGLIEASLDPVLITGPSGRITDVNAAAEQATGHPRRTLIGTDVTQLFTEPEKARRIYYRALRDGTVRGQELALSHRDGHTMPVLYNATVYRDANGKVVGIFAAARDITQRKQVEEALNRRQREFEALAERSPDVIARVDSMLRLRYINPAIELLTGQPRALFLGKGLDELGLSRGEKLLRAQALRRVFESGREQTLEHQYTARGDTRYFQARLVPEFSRAGDVESVLVVERDITELKNAQFKLEQLSLHDPLTGAANRRYLELAVDREWRREARHGHPIALIMVDIDHFKAYNDRYGHLQGDNCLRQVALSLRKTLHRPADTLVRYGGEEFAILLPGTDLAAAQKMAERLRQAVEELRLCHAASPVADHVTISLGVAAFRAREGNFDELLTAADGALYRAKDRGRNRVEASP